MNLKTCDVSGAKTYETNGLKINTILSRESSDCSVHAISIAADISYEAAHDILKAYGRKNGCSPKNFSRFLRWSPFRWSAMLHRGIKLGKFIDRHQKGRFLLVVRPKSYTCHVFVLIDGELWNVGIQDSLNQVVQYAWRLEGLKKK